MDNFKPLLADPVDFKHLRYPCVVSPKLDGIRAVNLGNGLVSRNMKPIKNKFTQELLGLECLKYFDGELIVGDPAAKDCYGVTNSGVMSADGKPDVTYYVFDYFKNPDDPFSTRFADMVAHLEGMNLDNFVKVVPHTVVNSYEELMAVETEYLERGYEGVMIRDRGGRYKFGRSTAKEGILLKLKRFTDAEAYIVGFEELMSNQNEAMKDALGRTERSAHQAGLVPMGTLGALIVEHAETKVQFNIGTGFTAYARADLWARRDELLGRMIKFKSFEIGVKDKPRFPVFLGFREDV